jgi:hypothetical protein
MFYNIGPWKQFVRLKHNSLSGKSVNKGVAILSKTTLRIRMISIDAFLQHPKTDAKCPKTKRRKP